MNATLYAIEPPTQYRAGFIGTSPNQTPFFFGCGKCGQENAILHGYWGTGPNFADILLYNFKDKGRFGTVTLALLCGPCYKQELEKALSTHSDSERAKQIP